jgi:hypothetical protein
MRILAEIAWYTAFTMSLLSAPMTVVSLLVLLLGELSPRATPTQLAIDAQVWLCWLAIFALSATWAILMNPGV